MSADGLTVASPVSPLLTLMTTSVAGSASRTTVKSSVDPASVTVVPPIAVTVTPAGASLSVVVTVTTTGTTLS